jgi:hypothetical protein
MENVPDVIGSNFIKDFKEWEEFLRSLATQTLPKY